MTDLHSLYNDCTHILMTDGLWRWECRGHSSAKKFKSLWECSEDFRQFAEGLTDDYSPGTSSDGDTQQPQP